MPEARATPPDADPRVRELAAKLFWWKGPDEALADQRRFLAQAMTYGSWDDMALVRSIWGADALRVVLTDAPPGVFDRRSWSYWHAIFGIAPVPPLPRRRLCRLRHRVSMDFDFFLPRSFEPGDMVREISSLGAFDVVQSAPDTLGVRMDGVWLSLFGVKLAAIAPPAITTDIGLPVASLRDLGATKVQTIVDRAEAKDYHDIAALLGAGVALPDMLGSAQIVFGSRFSPLLALKALTSFEDGDLPTLPEVTRRRLVAAAASVDRIPILGAYSATIFPAVSIEGDSS